MRMRELRTKAVKGFLEAVDDRKTSWVYVVPVVIIASIFAGVLQGQDGDSKLQAALLLGLAAIAMVTCWIWAARLSKLPLTLVDYVKGTTTSRVMLWFWVVFGISSAGTEAIGIGSKSFMPLWESSILAFGGVGSILLTAGPAYKEYREAQAVAQNVQ